MDEASFWDALEYRVSREMAGVAECRRLGMWCDGFLAQRDDFDAVPGRILGRVWIGLGPRNQESWTFRLLLPASVSSRDRIRWPALLPEDGDTQWLGLDMARKHLIVAPADAVGDAP